MRKDDRRQKLIANLIAGMDRPDAARAAGYSESYARVNVYALVKSSEFQEELAQARTASASASTKARPPASRVSPASSPFAYSENLQVADKAAPDVLAELTIKQRRFKDAYLGEANGNGTLAARLAGYEGDDKTLAAIGSENLRKPNLRAAIMRDLETMTPREVLAELTTIARADWQHSVDVRYGDEGEIIAAKLILKDKIKALELVGKYHQLFNEPVNPAPIVVVATMTEDERMLRLADLVSGIRRRAQMSIDVEGRVLEQGAMG